VPSIEICSEYVGQRLRGTVGSVERRTCLAPHIRMCKLTHMPTNLAIDDELLSEAQKVGGHRTKKDTVNEALREYIQRRRQVAIVDLFGTVEFDAAYDYKKQRRRP
jgi:hypothetical protein